MRATLILPVLLALTACGKPKPATPTPQAQVEAVRRLTRRGNWTKALPELQRLGFEATPGRTESPEIAYLTGEALFQTGALVEAAAQFRQVSDHFPESPYAPLALLRAGDANMRLWRLPQLDPTYGEAALAIYQELNGRYPESNAAGRANIHVRRVRTWMAEKAYRNGMFYLRRRAYDSGILYFKEVVALYSDTPWASHAVLRLIDSYHAIGYNEERKETCEHVRRFYPRVAVAAEKCPASEPAANTSP